MPNSLNKKNKRGEIKNNTNGKCEHSKRRLGVTSKFNCFFPALCGFWELLLQFLRL